MAGASLVDRVVNGLLDGTLMDPDRLPELVHLPTWAEPERLRSLVTIGAAIAVILLLLAARLLRRLVVRAVVMVALAALTIGLWDQRSELKSCVATCDCSVFGQAVAIPLDLNPRCS